MELCADGLADALLDEAEQIGFDVVSGKITAADDVGTEAVDTKCASG
jgi:hypothetical protein